jgi:hypothetical protein
MTWCSAFERRIEMIEVGRLWVEEAAEFGVIWCSIVWYSVALA